MNFYRESDCTFLVTYEKYHCYVDLYSLMNNNYDIPSKYFTLFFINFNCNYVYLGRYTNIYSFIPKESSYNFNLQWFCSGKINHKELFEQQIGHKFP